VKERAGRNPKQILNSSQASSPRPSPPEDLQRRRGCIAHAVVVVTDTPRGSRGDLPCHVAEKDYTTGMNTRASFLIGLSSVLFSIWSAAAPAPLPDGFYRYPTIGGGAIVFAAEGDLWKVPEAGGVALRLTAFEGEEAFPKLSPDGSMVAFTAQYEGNDDVYVMTASGGEPVRLTYHPAPDQALGWSPDGKILFRSRRDTPNNDFRI